METGANWKVLTGEFQGKDPANVRSPATFLFLAQYVIKLEKNYRSNPSLFDLNFSPMNVGIKPVCYGPPSNKPKTSVSPPTPLLNQPAALAPSVAPKDSNQTTSHSTTGVEWAS